MMNGTYSMSPILKLYVQNLGFEYVQYFYMQCFLFANYLEKIFFNKIIFVTCLYFVPIHTTYNMNIYVLFLFLLALFTGSLLFYVNTTIQMWLQKGKIIKTAFNTLHHNVYHNLKSLNATVYMASIFLMKITM